MTPIDLMIWLLMLIFAARGFTNGLSLEVAALLIWFFCIFLGIIFVPKIAHALPYWMQHERQRIIVAFILVCVGAVIAEWLIHTLITRLLRTFFPSMFDRILGAVIGFIRGVGLLILLILCARFTRLSSTRLWQEIAWVQELNSIVTWISHVLPDELLRYFQAS